MHKLRKGRLPYSYDLNIYRGCNHQCQYCYAIYSHKYLETGNNFFNEIFVKTNIVENLEKELSSLRWKKDIINLGGVCDSYQPAESKYKLMPEILKVLIKYENPVIISTKSDLILRDFDLFLKLAKKTYVNIAVTVTTGDESIWEKIEPFTHSPERRFNVLRQFNATDVNTGLHMMPVLPFITDGRENFEQLFFKASECRVDYVLTGFLNLIGDTRKHFLNFIKKEFPKCYSDYLSLYHGLKIKQDYKKEVYKMIYELKYKYGLSSIFFRPIKDKLGKQMKMF